MVPPDPGEGEACVNAFIVAAIGQLRAELARISDAGEGQENCPTSDVATITLPGDGTKSYAVELKIQGAAEFNTYPGATFEQGRVATGGVSDGRDTWRLQIDDIALDVHINGLEPVGPPPSLDIAQWNYIYAVTIKNNATITLSAGSLGTQLANVDRLPEPQIPPPGVAPYPAAFNGQFMQVSALSAVEV